MHPFVTVLVAARSPIRTESIPEYGAQSSSLRVPSSWRRRRQAAPVKTSMMSMTIVVVAPVVVVIVGVIVTNHGGPYDTPRRLSDTPPNPTDQRRERVSPPCERRVEMFHQGSQFDVDGRQLAPE
jgi:hypothetical protein